MGDVAQAEQAFRENPSRSLKPAGFGKGVAPPGQNPKRRSRAKRTPRSREARRRGTGVGVILNRGRTPGTLPLWIRSTLNHQRKKPSRQCRNGLLTQKESPCPTSSSQPSPSSPRSQPAPRRGERPELGRASSSRSSARSGGRTSPSLDRHRVRRRFRA